MPKIILEKEDIERLIKEAYGECEIVSGLDDLIDIIIKVDSLRPKTIPPMVINSEPKPMPKPTPLENREITRPGGAMGRNRNTLPKF